jgi:hypothetical protein
MRVRNVSDGIAGGREPRGAATIEFDHLECAGADPVRPSLSLGWTAKHQTGTENASPAAGSEPLQF